MILKIISILFLSFLVSSCRSAATGLNEKQVSTEISALAEGMITISTPVPNTQIGTAIPTATPSPTMIPALIYTRTINHTQTATPGIFPTASITPEYTLVDVYFVNESRLTNNQLDLEVAGVRWARSNNLIGTVLDEYFRGPGATERSSYGWIGVYDGFTGYSKFEIINGMARLYLTGTCKRANPGYTIADILVYNLKQFPEIQYVKIYDQNGLTKDPFGISDSIPACLEP